MTKVITIGRQFGSAGHDIGELIAKELGFKFYDKELVEMAAKKENISAEAMPVPRDLSSSCGTCVKFETDKDINAFTWSQEVEQVVEITDSGYVTHYHIESENC